MSDVLELENEIYQDEPEQSTEQVEEEFIAPDRKSTRLNSSHKHRSRMPSSA